MKNSKLFPVFPVFFVTCLAILLASPLFAQTPASAKTPDPDLLPAADTLPPLTVEIISPADGADFISTREKLKWSKPYSKYPVLYYGFQVAKDDTANIIHTENVHAPLFYTPMYLRDSSVYYWRVRAKNKYGYNQYCKWSKFTIRKELFKARVYPVPTREIIDAIKSAAGYLHIASKDGLFHSTNSGSTWKRTTFYGQIFTWHYRLDNEHKKLLAFCNKDFFAVWDDSSKSWGINHFAIDRAFATDLAYTDQETGFLSSSQGIYKTTNGGFSWTRAYYAPYGGTLKLIICQGRDTLVAAGERGVVLVSTNRGKSFSKRNYPADQTFIRADFTSNRKLILWSYYGIKYTSSDLGLTWTGEYFPFPNKFVYGLHFKGYDIFLTTDGGIYSKREGTSYYYYDLGMGPVAYPQSFNVNDDFTLTLPGYEGNLYVGTSSIMPTSVKNETEAEASFLLEQNFPNPFNSTTIIPCSIAESGDYRLEIFDCLGRSVSLLFSGWLEKGKHQYKLQCDDLASGIYFSTLSGGNGNRTTRKLVLLK